jgi:hypothetical protein
MRVQSLHTHTACLRLRLCLHQSTDHATGGWCVQRDRGATRGSPCCTRRAPSWRTRAARSSTTRCRSPLPRRAPSGSRSRPPRSRLCWTPSCRPNHPAADREHSRPASLNRFPHTNFLLLRRRCHRVHCHRRLRCPYEGERAELGVEAHSSHETSERLSEEPASCIERRKRRYSEHATRGEDPSKRYLPPVYNNPNATLPHTP